MTRWEYKTVLRSRGWPTRGKKDVYVRGTDWDIDTDEVLALGEEGWELVSVVPISNVLGSYGQWWGAGGETSDYAGFTNEQLWVFKRPKE